MAFVPLLALAAIIVGQDDGIAYVQQIGKPPVVNVQQSGTGAKDEETGYPPPIGTRRPNGGKVKKPGAGKRRYK